MKAQPAPDPRPTGHPAVPQALDRPGSRPRAGCSSSTGATPPTPRAAAPRSSWSGSRPGWPPRAGRSPCSAPPTRALRPASGPTASGSSAAAGGSPSTCTPGGPISPGGSAPTRWWWTCRTACRSSPPCGAGGRWWCSSTTSTGSSGGWSCRPSRHGSAGGSSPGSPPACTGAPAMSPSPRRPGGSWPASASTRPRSPSSTTAWPRRAWPGHPQDPVPVGLRAGPPGAPQAGRAGPRGRRPHPAATCRS